MSTPDRSAPKHARLVLAGAVLLAAGGVAAWQLMPRQEDPTFPARYGVLTVVFPGADAETVERLVLDPMEDELAQVEEIAHLTSTARTGVTVTEIELREDIYETEDAWSKVRTALARAERELPDDAREPELDTTLVRQESMVIAVAGHPDPLVLRKAARTLKRRLAHADGVARVNIIGDPGEQVTVEYDAAAARRVGITPRALAQQLQSRNVTIPGGAIRMGDTTANLRPQADFASVDELEATPITLPSGAAIPLGKIADVRKGPAEPPQTRMRLDGESAIAVGVVPQSERHLLDVGTRVRSKLDELRSELSPLQLHEVTFQPDYVEARLDGLGTSLLLSVLIVAGVLLVLMGRRPALVVAAMVPLVTLGSLALFWFGGGVLHQMSIAAFVIALGMLVDNAIVMVELVQARIDEGLSPAQAARQSVRELRLPLTTATGTTAAAFLPMWLAKGTTPDFTRALPVVIVATLVLSLVFALLVTPTVSALVLGRSQGGDRDDLATRVASALSGLAVRRYRLVLAGAVILMVGVGAAAGLLDQQFFPSSDRDQFVVELRMPEGSHLDRVDEVAATLERTLVGDEDIRSVASFVGRSVPRFYYNLPLEPHAPQLAQLLVTTRDKENNPAAMARVRDVLRNELPEVQGIVRPLAQGPAMVAPIEVRLYGEPEAVGPVAESVLAQLKKVPGAVDARHDVDLGTPTVRLDIVDAAASRHGVARSDVALALLGQTRGVPIGTYRGGDRGTVPIVLRSSEGEEFPVDDLPSVGISRPGGELVPLGQVARPEVEWQPAVVHHRDGRRMSRVLAQLEPGVPFGRVLAGLKKRLSNVDVPKDVRLELGGAAEGSGKANASMLKALPIGVLLMVLFLIWEFNSFRRMAIVLSTVPIAAVGIVPGLLIGGEPFGFMSLLGVIALAGIVVNNAIVLLDVVERERQDGATIPGALRSAVRTRTRPILLTTATTVGGLVPLAFSSSTLWPPLAWAMITGLLGSSLLTLLVVPALYRVLFREPGEARLAESEGVEHEDTRVESLERVRALRHSM